VAEQRATRFAKTDERIDALVAAAAVGDGSPAIVLASDRQARGTSTSSCRSLNKLLWSRMPSDPPPASAPSPASAPPASNPGTPPATADTINQALDAVKQSFPADSSPLADLRLDANDDTTASVTAVLNAQPGGWMPADLDPILDAIASQFTAQNVPQTAIVSYELTGDDSESSPPSSNPPPPSSQPS
jgi:hypothetical protein